MIWLLASLSTVTGGQVTVRPTDTGAGLDNPGLGWVLHYYDNNMVNYGSRLEPADTVDDFPGLTTIYLRLPWSALEPEEGVFRWSTIDTPAQRWLERGKQLAFRFTCCETPYPYATPEWVEAAGAKGYRFTPGQGIDPAGTHWEPDYDDPVFLAKLENFLAAAGARYDGRPEVAFVDIGSIGVWGEGHTFHSTKRKLSRHTLETHLALHRKYFPRTLLAINDDFQMHEEGEAVIREAAAQGLTLRDDSIMVQPRPRAWFHGAWADWFWRRVPVILESEHYGGSVARNAWYPGGYLEAVEEYHASYTSIHWWPREFLASERPEIEAINRRLGYRLQLLEASWPEAVRLGEPITFTLTWRNAGVAPCYPGGCPALTLRDEAGGIAAVFAFADLELRDLPVGPPDQAEARTVTATCRPPYGFRAGLYRVEVSAGLTDGTPRFELPLADGVGRRYPLGELRVRGDFALTPGELRQTNGDCFLTLTIDTPSELPAGLALYCHADAGGRISFQGYPIEPVTALRQPGRHPVTVKLTPPADARGRTFELFAGLWLPERLGRPDERLLPDRGGPDRRVHLGALTIDDAGRASFRAR